MGGKTLKERGRRPACRGEAWSIAESGDWSPLGKRELVLSEVEGGQAHSGSLRIQNRENKMSPQGGPFNCNFPLFMAWGCAFSFALINAEAKLGALEVKLENSPASLISYAAAVFASRYAPSEDWCRRPESKMQQRS